MKIRSLLQLFIVLSAAALFTETAQAAVYQSPDLSNPLEGRIKALREGKWQPLLTIEKASNLEGQSIASYWGNGGGGRAWGNGGGGRAWGNGGGWGNGGSYYGGGMNIGWPNGGWGNGGWGNGIPGTFINW